MVSLFKSLTWEDRPLKTSYSISIAVVVPFNAASLVETVQSDIASEKPGVFDVFREGISRLSSWSAPQKGRMIPVWALLGPSISLGLTKYIFGFERQSFPINLINSLLTISISA